MTASNHWDVVYFFNMIAHADTLNLMDKAAFSNGLQTKQYSSVAADHTDADIFTTNVTTWNVNVKL